LLFVIISAELHEHVFK